MTHEEKEIERDQQAINIVGRYLPTDPRRGLERAIAEALSKRDEEIKELRTRVAELEKEKEELIWQNKEIRGTCGKVVMERNELQNRLSTLEGEQIVNCCAYQSFRGRICNKCGKYNMTFKEEIKSLESKLSTLLKASEGMEKALENLSNEINDGPKHTGMTIVFLYKSKQALADFRVVKEGKQ